MSARHEPLRLRLPSYSLELNIGVLPLNLSQQGPLLFSLPRKANKGLVRAVTRAGPVEEAPGVNAAEVDRASSITVKIVDYFNGEFYLRCGYERADV